MTAAAPANIQSAKWTRLVEFLGGLPTAAATRLFAALELDRAISESAARKLSGERGLPHDALLEALRAVLFERDGAFPARTMTAQRLFFAPFEDFIIAVRRGKKRRARIARPSLQPIWALVLNDAACAGAAGAAAQLTDLIADGDPRPEDVSTLQARMFAGAGEGFDKLISLAEKDAGFRASLAARLGEAAKSAAGAASTAGADSGDHHQTGVEALHDLAELNLLMPAADHFKFLQDAFPKPVRTLTEEDYYDVRKLYAAAQRDHPDAAPYLLLALAGRLDAPWRALGVYYNLARADDEQLPAAGDDCGVIVETLFDDLEGMTRMLEKDAEGLLEAENTSLRLTYFSDYAEGLMREAARANDGVVANRVGACRDLVSTSLVRFSEQAMAALRKAMPVRHAGGSSRLAGLRPDFSRRVDAVTAKNAGDAALLIARSPALASRLERPGCVEGVLEEAGEKVGQYAGDLIMEIRAAESEDRTNARAMMDHTLMLAGPLLPASEVVLLKERATAAAHSA